MFLSSFFAQIRPVGGVFLEGVRQVRQKQFHIPWISALNKHAGSYLSHTWVAGFVFLAWGDLSSHLGNHNETAAGTHPAAFKFAQPVP